MRLPLRPALIACFIHGAASLLLIATWFRFFTLLGYFVAAAYWGLLSVGCLAGAALLSRRLSASWAPPLLASAFVFLEWLRSLPPLNFPWGSLAAAGYSFPPILQILEFTGAYGLSWMLALPAAGMAAGGRAGRFWSAGGAALLLTAGIWGAGRLAAPVPAAATLPVAVVQASRSEARPGAGVVCSSDPELYMRFTREALELGARVVVWPESAGPADLVQDSGMRTRLSLMLRRYRAALLAGSMVYDEATGRWMNAAVLVDAPARTPQYYAKVLLVPFGEYLPARALLGWTTAKGMPAADMLPGEAWHPLNWWGARFGVSICFESAFSEPSRRSVLEGADILALLTSDGWAGRSAAGLQHLAFAPLRAVENRRSAARAAATGVSQLIDPHGRVLAEIPMFTTGFRIADLPLPRTHTFFTRAGDWPLTAILLLLASAAAALLLERRKRGDIDASTGKRKGRGTRRTDIRPASHSVEQQL